MYFDSRTYLFSQLPAFAARNVAQPMTDGIKISKLNTTQLQNSNLKMFVNPDTFQILCSGQDGDFGMVVDATAGGSFSWNNTKQFPGMLNTNEEDSDNIADFTEGARLIDKRP